MMAKRRFLSPVLFLILVLPTFSDIQRKSSKDLPGIYQKWLDEEVVYIITPVEKEVYLQLETNKERELFIEAFWRQRDPNPNTLENEFKVEHYRRINYANQWFGKDSPGPGWRSAMGRIYIILGEPRSIERFENMAEVFPVIIWFYGGLLEYGLPNAFNVVFFKRSGMGEYELYTPIKYGPQHLLIHYMGDPTDHLAAYKELFQIEPAIANVSMTLIPGESSQITSPSIASEILISSKIPSAPKEKVKDAYAEKLLRYKEIIEVEYSANYIDSDYSINIIKDDSGIFFVHYLIEPKKLSLEQYGNKFYTKLEINGQVTDLEGNTIYQYEKTIPLEFDEEQLGKIKAKLFSFQDMFPMIAGDYKFSLLLKNTTFKEFTSIERNISITESTSLAMSPLALANRTNKDTNYGKKNKPFQIKDTQLVLSPRNDFSVNDNLFLFFQIYGLDSVLKENGYLEYSIFKDDKRIHSSVKETKEYHDGINFFEEFSLANLPPAHYSLKVSLFNQNKEEVLSEQNNFYISQFTNLPRPWILSLQMPPSDDPSYPNILGNQYLSQKDFPKSKTFLERAYQKNPNSVKFALDFCRVLYTAKEYQRVKQVAVPFLENQEKYEFLGILGQACQNLGEFGDAIAYYKDYLSHFGTNLEVLNAIGECYYRMDNNEDALIAWERSLEINPKQEKIKKIVDLLKNMK